MAHINRKLARKLGVEAVEIIDRGWYEAPDGARVELTKALDAAVAGTIEYPPGAALPRGESAGHITRVTVTNTTTLAAARAMHEEGAEVGALNFASAKNPGGGFLNGARAQEEYLARSSGLYACIRDAHMYTFHRGRRDPMYTNYAIYSPAVPVFRGDDNELLAEPFPCAVVTAPAPNAKVVLRRDPSRRQEVEDETRARIEKVLAILAGHGHTHVVLGAWGCGAFGGSAEVVARLFDEAIWRGGPFDGVFEHVAFAVLDWSDDRRFIGPFEERFG